MTDTKSYKMDVCLQGRLDVRDAASSSFLTEVAATLKNLQSLCGNEFLAYLQSTAIPATKLPTNAQVQCTERPLHVLQADIVVHA